LCSPNNIVSTISLSEFDKVVIEIGIGDGQLLEGVIDYENSPNTCYIVDQFIFVLPPPIYIDRELESQWTLLYQKIYKKLKEKGNLTLVTEVTNDLLEPVSNDEFMSWKTWLTFVFVTLGFTLVEVFNECPLHYRSRFLEQFKADQLRIKIITLILEKPNHKSI